VFGLNFTTTERDLDREFGRFGKLTKVQVVLDGPTKRSRGFAFIYYERTEDAEKAREEMNGTEISGFKIRVDFSITKAAHRPTPGVYFHHGKATRPGFRLGRDGRGGGGGRRGDHRDHYRDNHRDHRERDRYDDRHDDRDKYYDRRPPPSHYDRGYDRERDYHGPPRHRDERHYDHHRDPRERERERYYEDRYRDDRYREDRYREDRYRDDRYERPPRDYYERDRGYDRYEGRGGGGGHYPSSSSRRSASPGPPPRY